jgi:hypothetical protein
LLPVLTKTKEAYTLWHTNHELLPKTQRYSLGNRIDALYIELIEALATATFLVRDEKLPYVRLAIRKLDTIKVLLLVLFDTKAVDIKRFIALSVLLDEIGRMLGGWYGQLTKQNSPEK